MSMDDMAYEEFIDKYGDEKVLFSSYYKYTFNFRSVNGLLVSIGGCSDEIYRASIEAGVEYSVRALNPCSAYLDGTHLGY